MRRAIKNSFARIVFICIWKSCPFLKINSRQVVHSDSFYETIVRTNNRMKKENCFIYMIHSFSYSPWYPMKFHMWIIYENENFFIRIGTISISDSFGPSSKTSTATSNESIRIPSGVFLHSQKHKVTDPKLSQATIRRAAAYLSKF